MTRLKYRRSILKPSDYIIALAMAGAAIVITICATGCDGGTIYVPRGPDAPLTPVEPEVPVNPSSLAQNAPEPLRSAIKIVERLTGRALPAQTRLYFYDSLTCPSVGECTAYIEGTYDAPRVKTRLTTYYTGETVDYPNVECTSVVASLIYLQLSNPNYPNSGFGDQDSGTLADAAYRELGCAGVPE